MESLVHLPRQSTGRTAKIGDHIPNLADVRAIPRLAWLPLALCDCFVVAFGVMGEEAEELDAVAVDPTGVLDLLLDLLMAAASVTVDCYAPERVRADRLPPPGARLAQRGPDGRARADADRPSAGRGPAPRQWRYQVAWLSPRAQAVFPPLRRALARGFRERLGAASGRRRWSRGEWRASPSPFGRRSAARN